MLNCTFDYSATAKFVGVLSLGKTLNANFLIGSLCGVERQHRGLFHHGIYRRKKLKNQIKKTSGYGTAGISESGSGQLPYA